MLTIWLNCMVNMKKDASTEEKILAAAKKVFISKGMAGARMQDIADEAGINKALLHYYFKSKEQLFEKIFLELSQRFWPQLNSIFESDEPLFEKIEHFCSVYIDKIRENPYIPLFVLYEMNQRPTQFIKKMFGGKVPKPAKLLAQMEADVKAGKIKPIQPHQLMMNMVSMCIFPFVAKPMILTTLNLSESAFAALMEERKKAVPKFIIDSLRK